MRASFAAICAHCRKSVRLGHWALVYGFVDYDRLLELGGEPDFELGWLRPPVHDWHCADCGHEWRETD